MRRPCCLCNCPRTYGKTRLNEKLDRLSFTDERGQGRNSPMNRMKPPMLKPGDTVAAVSLSWGGPGALPLRYQAGKRQFEEAFGVSVVETRNALRDPEWLAGNPEARAEDLMEAFADKTIQGVISTIGGDDSIRTLPFIDLDIIRRNPKIFMGYSDTTITHAVCFRADLVSFYGPAFMSGFAENTGLFPYLEHAVRKTLFSDDPIGLVAPNKAGWTVEHLDWGVLENQLKKRRLNPSTGWTYHQDGGVSEGMLFGGCLEVLDWLRGTPYWPGRKQLEGAILFLETSEEAPPPSAITRFIRSLATMGVLEKLSGILLGRPGGQIDPNKHATYAEALRHTVREEYGLTSLPLVTDMDFGHTDPFFVLPLGVHARIDSDNREFIITESGVSA